MLGNSVRKRVETISRDSDTRATVSILFSAGLDSTVLAALCHQYVPITEVGYNLNIIACI